MTSYNRLNLGKTKTEIKTLFILKKKSHEMIVYYFNLEKNNQLKNVILPLKKI
jgi:hypothetical protein